MRVAGFEFTPRPVPTLAALALIVLTVSLGSWQAGRAAEKAARQALLEDRVAQAPLKLAGAAGTAEALVFRRVRVEGRFDAAGQIFIDNRVHGARAGFHVVTPLEIGGSGARVLVNRGWVARSADYPAAPAVAVPPGDQMVEGLATLPPERFVELSEETVTGNVWQNLSLARYTARTGREILPVVILASPAAPGLGTVEERPDTGIAKHHEYSLTWYSLAATLVVLWVAVNLRRAVP